MLLKSADDKTKDIAALNTLLVHPAATASVLEKIRRELRCVASGVTGETDAAYEINFHYEQSKNWAVIHDLRLEHSGRVAQIDHILINRVLDIWVCESKRFSAGLAINEYGEFSSFFDDKPYGVPSPIEQNHKHCFVVQSLLDSGVVKSPTRLGLSIEPTVKSMVLISKNARIERPSATIDGLDEIVKVDQFFTRVDKAFDRDHTLLSARKLIGSATLETFTRDLASQHRPATFDWYAKFGLPKEPTPIAKETKKSSEKFPPALALVAVNIAKSSKLVCDVCGKNLSSAVAHFCTSNKARFGGKLFCMTCQKNN